MELKIHEFNNPSESPKIIPIETIDEVRTTFVS